MRISEEGIRVVRPPTHDGHVSRHSALAKNTAAKLIMNQNWHLSLLALLFGKRIRRLAPTDECKKRLVNFRHSRARRLKSSTCHVTKYKKRAIYTTDNGMQINGPISSNVGCQRFNNPATVQILSRGSRWLR